MMTLYATPLGRSGPPDVAEGYRDDHGHLHGTRWSYDQGCRCDQCLDAKRASRRRDRTQQAERAQRPVPVAIDHATGWADMGACRHHPTLTTDAWYPDRNYTNDNHRAERVCKNECAVRARCEQYGRDHQEMGIWGGERLTSNGYLSIRRRAAQ